MVDRFIKAKAPVIIFDSVEKFYGEQKALCDINMTIQPGQFTVLLGPSGSGKSTMLRCLGGLEHIDSGVIRFGDEIVSSSKVHKAPDRRNLSMVFQDFALWPHMTVFDNVAFSLGRTSMDKSEAQKRVMDLLERVGLAHYSSRFPSTLSGGEQQRVSLARALVGAPDVILFDEPLSSLDADLRERLRVEIADLTREAGASALYITHDQSEAFALADVVGVLNKGELVQVGKPEEIYRAPASPFIAQFTGVAGELSGRVTQEFENGIYRIETAAGILDARGGGSDRLECQNVTLLVRSAPIRLIANASGAGELPGRVVDVAFRGRGYDHVIDLGHGRRLLGVFSEDRWERNEIVGVRIPPEACIAFPLN
ncbi:ABC transporter ATP-binding protein [Acidithrix ferrooxidans]|uniref:ABC-type quaternary amine transporter n=1 Tax=Acidithrix ferrooxidans TaxID=1280514 RepID=A0A0D8HDV0_9ACTN|nr:ABC transporter ATP-binding protein [Acidithrix ferrooxidans]KJF16059.1 trehalose import ATP-binding protein SugC [Acidithrix ferrooxidans]